MAAKKKTTSTKKVNKTTLEKEPSKTTTKSKTTSSSTKKSPSKETITKTTNTKTKKDVVKISSEPKTTTKTKTTKKTTPKKNTSTKSSPSKVVIKDKEPPKEKNETKKATSKKTTSEPKKVANSTKKKTTTKLKNSSTKATAKKGTNKKSSTKKTNKEINSEVGLKKVLKKITSTTKVLGAKIKENVLKTNSKLKSSLKVIAPKIKKASINIGSKTKKVGVTFFTKIRDLNSKRKEKKKERKIKNSEKRLIRLNKKSIKKANKEIKKQTKERINLNDYKVNEDNDLQKSLKLKKRRWRRLIFLAIICIILAVLLMIPYGTSIYNSDASGISLEVPKYLKLKEECCNYSATFNTFRSAWSLEIDLDNMISDYEVLDCEGKTYYYNEENNYTITDYGIKKGVIFNEVYITYGKGNSCDIDTSFKKLELLDDDFSLNDARKDGNYVIDGDNVYNASAYDTFMKNVKDKIPSVLRIVTTNKDGDVLITDLEYLSNGKFMVTYDGTRDRNTKDPRCIVAYKYEHLGVTKNMLYAYNGDEIVTKNPKKEQAYYLFTIFEK